MDKAVQKYISALVKKINNNLRNANKAADKMEKEFDANSIDIIMPSMDEELDDLMAEIRPYIITTLSAGFIIAARQAAYPNVFQMSDSWVDNYLFERRAMFNQVLNDMYKTTRESLVNLLIAGGSVNEAQDVINRVVNINGFRAERIARTESLRAINRGSHQVYMESDNVTHKQWNTTMDGKERESHGIINGEVVRVNEPFSNGLMYPLDPSGPAYEVINCRCTHRPLKREEL